MSTQYRSEISYRNKHQYNGVGVSTTQTVSARARIQHIVTQQLTAQSRIFVCPTISAKAYIFGPWRVTSRARIYRHQGWPVPTNDDPGFSLWQDTRLDVRTRISNYIAFSIQTIRCKSKITYGKTLSIQAHARIVTGKQIQAKACILPKFFTISIPAIFQVRRTSQTQVRAVFYVQGAVRNWKVTSKARIVQTYNTRVTGHFIATMPTSITSVMVVTDQIVSNRTQKLLSTRAKITR